MFLENKTSLYYNNIMSDILKNLISLCHERHNNPLRQRRTEVMPATDNRGYPHQHTVYCARNYPVMLYDIEDAGISLMPIGRAPGEDQAPSFFGGERFYKRQGVENWAMDRWDKSWGINVYTGAPSAHNGAHWHDLVFPYEGICAAPEAVLRCIEALVSFVENPLLVLTKSGGLRFSCGVKDYLHPNTDEAIHYVQKGTPTSEKPNQRIVFLEMLGKEGYSCWDARYEILIGNLLDPPVTIKEVLFAPINALRSELHEPASTGTDKPKFQQNTPPLSLDSYLLNIAKQSFLKRGFSYLRKDNNVHLWSKNIDKTGDGHVALWENEHTVSVCASTDGFGVPTTDTPITDVWDDTGLLPQIPATDIPISNEMLAAREGQLSPLAVKRPSPILNYPEPTKAVEWTAEQITAQLYQVIDQNTRVIALITENNEEKNSALELDLLTKYNTSITPPSYKFAVAAEQRYPQNSQSVVRWTPRTHLWGKVKDIPVDERMANPFQHGNMCEDADRCDSLEQKGGNASESICPQCPVYTECQDHGYLSQYHTLQHTKTQISSIPQMFFNPQYADIASKMLRQVDNTERLCIINGIRFFKLFPECELSRKQIEEWAVNWQGDVLGDFAKVLLNVLEIKSKSKNDAVNRIRTVVQLFDWQEETLVEQMCQVIVSGKVLKQGYVDTDTGQELAHFTVAFDSGCSAYIPLNQQADAKLVKMGHATFQLESFYPNENIKIRMSMAQAIEMGILNTETVDNIKRFPTVCHNPNWTCWHQLKRFYQHYSAANNPPMAWDGEILKFRVPPMLHKDVKRLLLISSTNLDKHLTQAFPEEAVQIVRMKPTTWLPGNTVFQIRTGTFHRNMLLDTDINWQYIGMSKLGVHLFLSILSEIDKEPSVKHAIITHSTLIRHIKCAVQKENVCFVTHFEELNGLNNGFEAADVIWVVSTPTVGARAVWSRAHILFGNDTNPIRYEVNSETGYYKDERVQSIYEEETAYFLSRIVEYARLDRVADKKIVLISSLKLPNITNRPENLLFDWEDFEIAGGIDQLAETIRTRERFEIERENITAETSREEVQRVLGCSVRQAYRFLQKIRGRTLLRTPYRDEILALLADGEKKTAEFVDALDGMPQAINYALSRLVDKGEIVRVKRGLYTLTKS